MTGAIIAEATDPATVRIAAVVRDIARGGLAGLIVGIAVCGIGGRLVMRLATLLVPAATGLPTENGNRIGDITLGGTMAVVMFAGLLGAVTVGVTWVAISPWLPGRGVRRGLVAAPIAMVLGSFTLVRADNPDFVILRHDPLVVASLLLLVGATMPAAAIADGWLDARLPRIRSLQTPAGGAYLAIAFIGALLGGLPFLTGALGSGGEAQPLALTVVLTGLVTLVWWRERILGRGRPSALLKAVAWSILLAGTAVGAVALWPELRGALGVA
jgi:hypothetical protein